MSASSAYYAALARQRLLNKARADRVDFNLLLTKFGLERFLYRLGSSEYGSQFILKGAMLYPIWGIGSSRPTMDADFLGFGSNSEQHIAKLFKEVSQIEVEGDGIHFDPERIRVEAIREEREYGGIRVQLFGYLEKARISIQIDIGFGDVVTPDASEVDDPTLLDISPPHLRIYPTDSVIAEKFQAMVVLGMGTQV